MLLKESIDSLDPERSLPIINVNAGYTVPVVVRAGYEWNFLTRIVRSPSVSPLDLPLVVLDCERDMPINVSFSAPYEGLKVSRAEGLFNDEFTQIDGEVFTPSTAGVYVYSVEASFKKGSIIYYFALEVRDFTGGNNLP